MIHEDITIGPVRLIRGDCTLIAPTLEGVDAVITDPPYGCKLLSKTGRIGSNSSKSGIIGRIYEPVIGDDVDFNPSLLVGYSESILWGANWFSSRLPNASRWLVWDKRDGTKSNNMADCEIAWTNLSGPSRCFSHRWMGMIRESEKSSSERTHPTQKPIALMQWCVGFTTGQLILDPYMGSGTTLIAAIRTGRRAIGIEIDERHFRTAVERVKRELDQFTLPLEVPKQPKDVELFR